MNNTPEIIGSEIKSMAQSLASEALGVVASIMRNSDNEKTRLLAAMAILDRAGRGVIDPSEEPRSLRERILDHMSKNFGIAYDEKDIRTALVVRSPETAIRAAIVQLYREGLISKTQAGKFTGLTA